MIYCAYKEFLWSEKGACPLKQTVAVVFGGVSTEHEVSRMSVTSVLENIDREAYTPIMVGIDKAGRWFRYEGPAGAILDGGWEQGPKTPCVLSPDRGHRGLLLLGEGGWQLLPVDVVFPVLHGKNGEDGTIQGLLELSGIPYVGCGVAASANCMDKEIAKTLFDSHGIPNARYAAVRHGDDRAGLAGRVTAQLGWPVFVKPAASGSSVGVTRVEGPGGLDAALDAAFLHDPKALIEEALVGAEVECAVMGQGPGARASQVIGQIVPKRGLYDYEGKYLDGSTDLYIPARVPEAQAQAVRTLAVRAYRVLECRGLARVDFFAHSDGKSVTLNEINTMPGFTSISMYPKLMTRSGLTYTQLISGLLELALTQE